MWKAVGGIVLLAGLAQGASAQQVCFAQNTCDFRGFACSSDVEELQASVSRTRGDAAGARRKAKKLQGAVNHLSRENKRLKAEIDGLGTSEDWARERQKVVGDYTLLMLCVRDAASLEAAKTCLDG